MGKEEENYTTQRVANFTLDLSFLPTPKMAVACMNGINHYISLIFCVTVVVTQAK